MRIYVMSLSIDVHENWLGKHKKMVDKITETSILSFFESIVPHFGIAYRLLKLPTG